MEATRLGNRTTSVPSVVFIRDDGDPLVGEAADRRAQAEPERVARQFKRRFGDSTPMILGGSPYGADKVTALLLRWVAHLTNNHLGVGGQVMMTDLMDGVDRPGNDTLCEPSCTDVID